MTELDAELEQSKTPSRTISVPPPPVDDFTTETARPTEEDDAGTTDVLESDDVEAASPVGSVEKATVALPRRRGSRALATRRSTGQMKPVTTYVPEHLMERITAQRLDADVAGIAFSLTDLFCDAVLALPSKPSKIAALIDRYGPHINFERRSGEPGFLDETRLSTRVSAEGYRHVASIIRAVHQEFGTRLSRKDLYAVALLQALAAETSA